MKAYNNCLEETNKSQGAAPPRKEVFIEKEVIAALHDYKELLDFGVIPQAELDAPKSSC